MLIKKQTAQPLLQSSLRVTLPPKIEVLHHYFLLITFKKS